VRVRGAEPTELKGRDHALELAQRGATALHTLSRYHGVDASSKCSLLTITLKCSAAGGAGARRHGFEALDPAGIERRPTLLPTAPPPARPAPLLLCFASLETHLLRVPPRRHGAAVVARGAGGGGRRRAGGVDLSGGAAGH